MTKHEDAINQLFSSIKSKTKELEEIEHKISYQEKYSTAYMMNSDDAEYRKMRTSVEEQEKQILALQNLALEESKEIENIKQEYELLARKKREKEIEISFLEQKENEEKAAYEEAQTQLNARKSIINSKEFYKSEQFSVIDESEISKSRNQITQIGENHYKEPESINFNNIFLLGVTLLILVLILKI